MKVKYVLDIGGKRFIFDVIEKLALFMKSIGESPCGVENGYHGQILATVDMTLVIEPDPVQETNTNG